MAMLAASTAWAVEPPKINPQVTPALKNAPQLGRDIKIPNILPDLRVAGVRIEGSILYIDVANDCGAEAPSSRLKIAVSGAPTTAMPKPHEPLINIEGDLNAIKAKGSGWHAFDANSFPVLKKTWVGRSFQITLNSDGKIKEASLANNTFTRSAEGLDKTGFPISAQACQAKS